MASNPDLPQPIILEIFSRLPAKSVGRCRCLSKSWRRDLSTTHFINKHLITRQQTNHQQQNLTLLTGPSLHIVTSPLKHDEQVKIWTGVPEKWHCLLGACNGLVLLVHVDENVDKKLALSVMNPITLQQVNVPYPEPAWANFWNYGSVFGFGYDCYSDDYKVISLQFSFPDEREHFDVPKSVTVVDVYSVKRGAWYRLHSDIYPYGGDLNLIPWRGANGAFLNGSVHWFICERKSRFYCHIAAFDLTKEVFHEIPIPPVPHDVSDLSGIDVIGGCLSTVHSLSNGGGYDVWMMKEYGVAESWVRFHIAGHDYGKSLVPVCMVGDEQLMFYTKNYDLVVFDLVVSDLVVSDLKDGTTKKVIVGGEDTRYWIATAFVDSLISPGKCDCDNDSG